MASPMTWFCEQVNPRLSPEKRTCPDKEIRRIQESWVAGAEKRVLIRLAAQTPEWIGPDHLTALATLRRKNGCYGRARSGTRQSHSVRVLHFPSFLFCCRNSHLDALTAVIACQEPTNINQIISDHAQADPALHASITAITTAIQPVTPFEHTDTPLRPGSPLLSSPEGAFLLMATSFGALGRAVGH